MADQQHTMRKTRFVCISDTHNASPGGAFKLPKGDVLIHAGDMTNQGSYSELQKTIKWLEEADFEAKILVAGADSSTTSANLQTEPFRKPRYYPRLRLLCPVRTVLPQQGPTRFSEMSRAPGKLAFNLVAEAWIRSHRPAISCWAPHHVQNIRVATFTREGYVGIWIRSR